MQIRQPIVAGRFYPSDRSECRAAVTACLRDAAARPSAGYRAVGGIVPHAGWICSGAVAAEVIAALLRDAQPETVVIFGAVHHRPGRCASVYARGAWQTPLGMVTIDEDLAREIVAGSPLLADDAASHVREHSIEVQVPIVQAVAPDVRILPIMVPPLSSATQVGERVAETVGRVGRRVVYLGSTDLTHYGPSYAFTPEGHGQAGIRWAKEINDRRLLERVERLEAEGIVPEAVEHQNACGPGAVAAAIAASRVAGATRARILRHTNSYEVLCDRFGDMEDAVGYAGVLFEAPLA